MSGHPFTEFRDVLPAMRAGKVGLRAVMELLAQATQGDWDSDPVSTDDGRDSFNFYEVTNSDGECLFDTFNSDLAVVHPAEDAGDRPWDETGRCNALAVVACVNFMRRHGPALAELIAANVEAATAKRVLEQDFKPGARVDASDPRVLRHIAAEERLIAALAQVQP